ncbi:MAG TPA: histidine kinase [Actinocrinis sp.]
MTRVYAWLQRHPFLVDGVMAAALVFFGLASTATARNAAASFFGTFIGLPIVLRRRRPVTTFYMVAAIALLQLAFSSTPSAADFAGPVALYAVAAYADRHASLPALGLSLVGVVFILVRWVGATGHEQSFDWSQWLFVYAVLCTPLTIAWVLGDSMRYRRAYYLDLEDKTRRLERERDQQAQIGAARERARIARELHDVVAHNVSVMVVQAEGASYAFDSAPESARQALGTIAETGRTALAEMRRLLGVLRAQASEADRAPQPGVDQLEDLLEQVRATGVPVDFTVEGVPVPLPQGMELAAYRIVQESLTNTRKHGGPRVRAQVALQYREEGLRMVVSDDGKGAAAPDDGLGSGLSGMRERVAMYGGMFRAGPRPGAGGFEVEVELPYQGAAAVQQAAAA